MDSFKTPLERRLDNLECHFTWSLSGNVHHLQDFLVECSQHDCAWEGHLYNLLGYITYHISKSPEEALTYLRKAEVALKGHNMEGRGPRLLVNQANLAWVHYLLGEQAKSEAYLKEVARLQEEFPAPPGFDLHPEVYGEKGWTKVKFEDEIHQKAIDNFELALRGDPDRKGWHTGLALAKYRALFSTGDEELKEEIIQQIKRAKSIDPDNLHLAAVYLKALAQVGRNTDDTVREAHDLVQRLRPMLHGLAEVLYFFRSQSLDLALQVAEEMVRKYPSEREAKKLLARYYKYKIFKSLKTQGNADLRELMGKCIHIYEEVTTFFPYYYCGKIVLADIYSISGNTEKADQLYMDLLKVEDLNPTTLQRLYFKYGKHLHYKKKLPNKSIDYHKKVAEIPTQSWEREKSMETLRSVAHRSNHRRCDEIQAFLLRLEQN
ncbi:interferon-induced protein with tetratricopeptide repeats 1-like [Clupea harengus]|uniref:Interferon-induced protein with tetratricopeptide repeats 1-like n=1 Tax=Clupea harengus TaxID=7950 RepID=A0A6P8G633_CLUHA|nr:interferon-induced protein with tetratricopeptide repeats 1-like [Clupea harengus]